MSFFTSQRGLKWHYTIGGDEGRPVLLFIHGFGGSHRLWERQVNHFLPDYRVITLDLPGHGQSEWVPVTLDDIAQDLREMFNELGIDQLTIVASSFGGMVSMKFFEYDPMRVQRIVFVGALPKFAKEEDYPAGLDIERIRKLSGQFRGEYQKILDVFFRSLFSKSDRLCTQFDWIRQHWKAERKPNREALRSFLDILEQEDLRHILVEMQCPIQIINGTEDYICPVDMIEWLRDNIDNVRCHLMEGAGHLPFLSRPDEFNQLVEQFV